MSPLTDPGHLVDELVTELPGWLPSQRWFAGKDRPVTAVRPLGATVLIDGDPQLLHVVVEVIQGDRQEPYQLLVGRRSHPPEIASGSWIGADGGLNFYEASGDADLTALLLDKIVAGERVGPLVFEHEPGAVLTGGLRARPITSEQSNTSLVYGGQYILKLFRKLSPGLNKDLLLHRALQAAGCEHIAEVVGSITGELAGEPTTIGMLQVFLPDAVDGWAMATTSVRDLMAEPELRPEELGGDFAGEAERLGTAVARVHADLASALGTEPVDDNELDRTVKAMADRLDEVARDVPELAEHVPALRAAFDAVRELPPGSSPISMQYVHGDLHLGQVLRTVGGWLLLDFEGEAGRAGGGAARAALAVARRRGHAALLRLRGPATARRPAGGSGADRAGTGVGAPQPRRLLRGLRPGRRGAARRPARARGTAPCLRTRQSGVRGRLRAREPAGLAGRPARGDRPHHARR